MPSKFFRQSLENIPAETRLFVQFYVNILKRINYLLEIKGYKQKDLAKLLDKKESEISKWLNGEHNLTLKTIAKLQVALEEPIITIEPVPPMETAWKKVGEKKSFSAYVNRRPEVPIDEFKPAEIGNNFEHHPRVA